MPRQSSRGTRSQAALDRLRDKGIEAAFELWSLARAKPFTGA